MNLGYVIKKAILSEKAYKQMEKGIYTFLVDVRARKEEIAKVVAKQFGVKVKKVNTSPVAGKKKRIAKTRKQVETGGGKKALVYLAQGESIAVLSPKAEKAKAKVQKKEKGLLGKIKKT